MTIGTRKTIGKGFALVVAFVGAVGLGAWIGPQIHRVTPVTDVSVANQAPQVTSANHPMPKDARRTSALPRDEKPRTRVESLSRTAPAATARSVPAVAPALHEVLKPVLNKGADMTIASRDFVDGEQFAAVAHAARNTEVPFMVLKHRVLDEGKSLEDAIREFKPQLNAVVEANRARAEAKSDIQALLG